MKCPYCGYQEQKVLDSRPARDNEAIRRRRECGQCERRFTTFEAPETHPLYVLKSDGSRQEFNKEKLLRGMVVACQKRSISMAILQKAADLIEQEILQEYDSEIHSDNIGKKVLQYLLDIDKIAYIRFASVYMHFQNPQEFQKIIKDVNRIDKKVLTIE